MDIKVNAVLTNRRVQGLRVAMASIKSPLGVAQYKGDNIILVNQKLLSNYTSEEITAMVIHEKAHISLNHSNIRDLKQEIEADEYACKQINPYYVLSALYKTWKLTTNEDTKKECLHRIQYIRKNILKI